MPGTHHRDPGSASLVDHPRFSRWYPYTERFLERAVGQARRQQNAQALGQTLILGAGTGLDVPALGERVTGLQLLEPDATMRRILARRYPDLPVAAWPAEAMPFDADSYDTVISTLVLCSVVDVDRVLHEVARVLTLGGQYLFLEHVRSPKPGVRWVQHGIEPVWRRMGGGCRLTRDVQTAVTRSPLQLTACDSVRSRGILPVIRGRAVRKS